MVKTKTKRNYRKRSLIAKPVNLINSPSTYPVPKQIITKLRYSQRFTLDAATGGVAYKTFGINDLRDPDHTGVGHQPMGFDQLMSFYSRFCVKSAKVTVVLNSQTSSGNATSTCGLQVHSLATYTPSHLSVILERGNCTYGHIGITAGSQASRTFTRKVSCEKWFGKNPTLDDTYYGSNSGSPTDGLFCTVFQAAEDSTFNPAIVDGYIVIEFISLFTDLRQIAQS